MVNEEKMKLMTDLAIFEKQNGRRMNGITSYFKSDYISRNMIKGFLSYTLCFVLIFVIWIIFHMDVFLSTIGLDALASLSRKTAVFYVLGLIVYMAVIFMVYSRRYANEYRKVRIYTAKLKHLDKRYDYQNRLRELGGEGRRL